MPGCRLGSCSLARTTVPFSSSKLSRSSALTRIQRSFTNAFCSKSAVQKPLSRVLSSRQPYTRSQHGQASSGGKRRTTQRQSSAVPSRALIAATCALIAFELLRRTVWSDGNGAGPLGEPLTPQRFTPFRVVGRDQVSSTAFVLTVRPKHARALDDPYTANGRREYHSSTDTLRQACNHGLWSVEVKQPQIQVARHYTPLPPQGDDIEKGHLRFLIRSVHGGEVSRYLDRLKLGDTIELRGPHLGFDVKKRLGDEDRVVFLAGGTGIAPAMQVASVLLESEAERFGTVGDRSLITNGDHRGYTVRVESPPPGSVNKMHDRRQRPGVSIVWANRHREDCDRCFEDISTEPPSGAGPILQQLAAMKRVHPELTVRCVVDDEKTFITQDVIAKAMGIPQQSDLSAWLWPQRGIEKPQRSSATCRYHSDTVLERLPENDPPEGECACSNHESFRGKRLLLVSGPDGFVRAYAGPKHWDDGAERQGAVGGIVGDLKQKRPEQWACWGVLKL